MKKVERTIFLDPEAAALLIQLAGGSRKQGDYLSALLRREARQAPIRTRLDAVEAEVRELRRALLADEEAHPDGG